MPRQGLLEGLGEVEEAPADDDVIVERHKETHLQKSGYGMEIRQAATTEA